MARKYYVDEKGNVRKSKKQPKYPIVLIIIGLLMILYAGGQFAYNAYIQAEAEAAAQEALNAMQSGQATDYSYLGRIDIPSIDIHLPVIDSWDNDADKLNTAPCVFSGSVDEGNLIIMAHNYKAHFGRLENITEGSEVTLSLLDGRVLTYRVTWIGEIDGSDAQAMQDGDWDLTLYTCNYSGQARITARCVLA